MIDNEWDFEQVYASFQPKIHAYLTRLIGAKEAEDLTQEVFIKVGKSLTTFRKESQLSTWIYRIATNEAIDRMRKPFFQRELTTGHEVLSHKEAEVIETGINNINSLKITLSPEEKVIRREMNECIQGIIQDLPDNYRMVVVLSELEGLQNKEIAEILGVNLDVVKVRLHRGKARLKKEFLNHCNFSWDEHNELTCDTKDSDKQ
ncbi:MAG: sigW [Firmicutes bacterium]|nr:sigW [Bacillota bacterium]